MEVIYFMTANIPSFFYQTLLLPACLAIIAPSWGYRRVWWSNFFWLAHGRVLSELDLSLAGESQSGWIGESNYYIVTNQRVVRLEKRLESTIAT